MQVDEALGQIAEIHDQLARGEHYRGFRPISVALSGLIGLLAALAWPLVVNFSWYDGAGPTAFAIFWLVVAAIAGGIGAEPAVYSYLFHENEFTRRRTRRIGGQFLPCVVAGLFVTIAAIRAGENVVHLLSGVWMLLFSLGVFAARPFLPRSIGWVGLFYLIAGALILARPINHLDMAAWAVGGTFAVGQVATAFVLHRNQERDADV